MSATDFDMRDEATAGFTDSFGYAPIGIWSAPGRVNLIGEHTDYNDGFVLPFAIDRRTIVALGLRDDRVLRVASDFADEVVQIDIADLAPDALHGWSAYPLGVAWALGENGADLAAVPGADLFVISDVPVGAGLSSSAAIESAVAVALDEVWQLGLDLRTLARVGQLAENKAVGAPTGIMDQSASLLGQADCAVFLDCRSLDAEVVELGFEASGLVLAIIDTHVSHSHATGGYAERRASCELGARMLEVPSLRHLTVADLPRARALLDAVTFRRVRHVVTENQRVLDTVRTLHESGASATAGCLASLDARRLRDIHYRTRSRRRNRTSERSARGPDDGRGIRRGRDRPDPGGVAVSPPGRHRWRVRRARIRPARSFCRESRRGSRPRPLSQSGR